MKKALITGITGQDGSYLAELLFKKNYEVHGMIRRSSSFNTARINHLIAPPQNVEGKIHGHFGDLTDATALIRLIQEIQPNEIYNLGAQSHVKVSFEVPEYTANADAIGTLRLLEAIKILKLEKTVRFYQASTSEMFGATPPPQNESTPFYPRSPYGTAKLYSYWTVVNYREAYGIHGSNGILFNHESPRRGETFVTRKITRATTRIKLGLQEKLYLGNLNATRDWGHAKEFVEAMYLMLQQEKPDDYVIATGQQHSVKEFCNESFNALDMEIEWQGTGQDEIGVDKKTGKTIVEIDRRYFRPNEVNSLEGDASKAQKILGWKPKITFRELVKEMVEADLESAKKELHLSQGNFKSRYE